MSEIKVFRRSLEEPGSGYFDRRLIEGARKMVKARAQTAHLFPKGVIRDGAWDILLTLLIEGEEGRATNVKQLIAASRDTVGGVMRRIEGLEEARFLTRSSDPSDQRRVIVRLTDRGRTALVGMLVHIFDDPC